MSRTFRTKLAGTSFKNPNGTDRQTIISDLVQPGQPLILIAEPENEFDKFAVGAWINCKGALHQIGYLDSRLAAEVTRLTAKGGGAAATIEVVTGGTPQHETLGVIFQMTKFDPGEKITQPTIGTSSLTTPLPPQPFLIDPPTPKSYSVGYMIGRIVRKIFT